MANNRYRPLFPLVLLATIAPQTGCAPLFAALAVSDAMHADADDGVAYRQEARQRREAFVARHAADIPDEIEEVMLAGCVTRGMSEGHLRVSLGEPQEVRHHAAHEMTWIYTDDVQLSHRDWETLWVVLGIEDDSAWLDAVRADPEAVAAGEIQIRKPTYRVLSYDYERL